MKNLTIILLFFLLSNSNPAQIKDYPISAVDIRNVKLTDNFWFPRIKLIQEKTIPYAFAKCESEGRMDNFLIAGGKLEGKVKGKMPFDDTDVYKIIEGASYSLINNPNLQLESYLDSIIGIIKIGQEPDGYITTWYTIDPSNPPAWWVKPPTKRWESEESSHELYNSGHLFEAAASHYFATGKRNFLEIALKNADLLAKNFGPGKLSIVPGHQIVETGLIKLYRITNNENYLELAKFFLDQRGNSNRKLFGEYSQDHLPVTEQREVMGHAVRAVYMYAAMTDIAALYDDHDYLHAVNNLWENMVNYKLYITGGIGARHDGESFGDNFELPNLTGYAETCAAIGSVIWNHRLFLLTGDSKYYDIIERTLYNGLISGISNDGVKFFYPNPLESDGNYTFNMGSCTRQSWFDCSCCPTNLIRFIPSIPGMIYAINKNSLYINLFVSNAADLTINNNSVKITQNTTYPLDNEIKFLVNTESPQEFTIKIRIPSWTKNKVTSGNLYNYGELLESQIGFKVNNNNEEVTIENGYAEITRTWSDGDEIKLILPMSVRTVYSNELLKDNENKIAIEYGPFVYCAEEIDNPDFDMVKIMSDSEFKVDRKNIPELNDEINLVLAKTNGTEIKLIPYYLWSNRGVGKMKVWLPTEL